MSYPGVTGNAALSGSTVELAERGQSTRLRTCTMEENSNVAPESAATPAKAMASTRRTIQARALPELLAALDILAGP